MTMPTTELPRLNEAAPDFHFPQLRDAYRGAGWSQGPGPDRGVRPIAQQPARAVARREGAHHGLGSPCDRDGPRITLWPSAPPGEPGDEFGRRKGGQRHTTRPPEGWRNSESSVNSKRSPWKRTEPCNSGAPESA